MSAQNRQLWLRLLARPLAICDLELTAIGVTLMGERTVTPIPPQHVDPISTVAELAATADSLRENADRLDRLVTAGFALSPEGSSEPVSQAELLNQLAKVQLMESRLEFTVQRLQQTTSKYRSE